jgi:hypothetical protein
MTGRPRRTWIPDDAALLASPPHGLIDRPGPGQTSVGAVVRTDLEWQADGPAVLQHSRGVSTGGSDDVRCPCRIGFELR